MKIRSILALLLTAALLLTGCSAAPREEMDANLGATVAGNGIYGDGTNSNQTTTVEESRKLIRTVSIKAETADLDAILADLDAQLATLGGYVQTKSVQNSRDSNSRYATLTLRIPADKLDSFVSHVEQATNILYSDENTEDVTLKYTATESRIRALEAEEARLLELVAQAGSLNDLLLLEQRLSDVREELEVVKSQLKLYDSLIDYGTLHLNITEVKEYTVVEEEEPTAWERIGTGFVKSLKGVWTILRELFIFAIVALPYLVIPAGIAVLVILLRRRKRKNIPQQPPFPTQPPVNE